MGIGIVVVATVPGSNMSMHPFVAAEGVEMGTRRVLARQPAKDPRLLRGPARWDATGSQQVQWTPSGRRAIFSGHFQLLLARGSGRRAPLPISFSSTILSPLYSLTSTNFFFALHHSCYTTPTFTFTTFTTFRPPLQTSPNHLLLLSKLPLPYRPPPASSLDTSNSYLPLPQQTPFSLPTSQLPRPRQHRRARSTSTLTKPLLQRH